MSPYVRILRPGNSLIMAASVLVIIAVISPSALIGMKTVWAVLSTVLIGSSSNVINDVFDIEIDRINRPSRVLPSGQMTVRAAMAYSMTLFGVGFLLSLPLGWISAGIAGTAVVLLIVYSSHLKKTVLWGNLMVSFIAALAFVYGGIAAGSFRDAVFPACFAFLITLSREIIKDMEDVEGDRLGRAATLPIRFGIRPAQVATSLSLALLVSSFVIAVWAEIYSTWFLVVSIGLITPIVGYVLVRLWSSPDRNILRWNSHLLKVCMLLGLLAIYLGKSVISMTW